MKRATPILALVFAASVSAAAGTTIQTVLDPGKLPPALAAFVQIGDLLVTDGKMTAVIAVSPRPAFSNINYGYPAVSGYLSAFLPGGASERAETQIGVPAVQVGGKALKIGTAAVKMDGAAILVRQTCESEGGHKLEIRTRYEFSFGSGRIDVTSEIRNAGTSEITNLNFGLGANGLQSLSFSPYNASLSPRLNFRVWQRPDHALGWYNPNPAGTTKAPWPGRLRPGQVQRASYSLLADSDPVHVLGHLYALAGAKPEQASFDFPNFDGLTELAIREPVTGTVFFRAFMDKPAPLTIPLPRGTCAVTANLFPTVLERTITVGGAPPARPHSFRAPTLGRVWVSISDGRGRPALGKVLFMGLSPTRSPYFAPGNPVATGRTWAASWNSVYPPRGGLAVSVPPGTYLVTSSRGPEYTREQRVVEVFAGDNPALTFALDKVVDTRGLLSIDTHMHTRFSDGNMLVADRLRSLIGEGLDAAVATDHNTITDYRPDLERLGLTEDLAVMSGVEVTARSGSIHFNAFPAEPRPGEPGNGAISVEDETPDTLFSLSRAKNPGSLVHVNHPRSRGLGYFLFYDLDSETAASARAPFSMDFDVMEILNGSRLGEANRASVEDWFHILNRGYAVRAVGSSDSHGIDGSEPGYARTYVLYDGPKGPNLDTAAVVAALKEGRSFVSTGPVVRVGANGKGTLGDTVKAKKGRIELDIGVTGAPWLDVSEVRLVVNGERLEPLPLKGAPGRTVKFMSRVKLSLERDSWIAVEVRGKQSLYPVIQQRSADGSFENAALPYAVTNPVFFDVDGDGRCDPVLPERIIVKEAVK